MEQATPGNAQQLTATGRSAIAVIQLSGDLTQLDVPTSVFRAANRKQFAEQSLQAICFGVWGDPGEEVVVCRTAADAIEVTCHGGAAVVARILDDAAQRGFAAQASPTVAFRSAKEPPKSEQHATNWQALIQARTQRTAELLLEQMSLWPQFIAGLSRLPCDEAIRQVDEALAWSEFGRHLVEPWSVVLCGRPNVGKSSLMNALAGFTRSIVSGQPGTTRDRVTLETAIDGWPVRITDTAGVRETEDSIEQTGVQQTLSALDQADLAVIVLDASQPLQPEDQQLLAVPTRRRIIIAHKSDLPRYDEVTHLSGTLLVSSVSGDGLSDLLRAISTALLPNLPTHGQPIPVSNEQVGDLRRLRE